MKKQISKRRKKIVKIPRLVFDVKAIDNETGTLTLADGYLSEWVDDCPLELYERWKEGHIGRGAKPKGKLCLKYR